MTEEKSKGPRVRSTKPFKLKDRPVNRQYVTINLKGVFGFVPETLIINKVPGSNNKFSVLAVLTPEEEKKEAEILKQEKKMIEDAKKSNEKQNNTK